MCHTSRSIPLYVVRSTMSSDHDPQLHTAMSTGDIVLAFQDGRSIRAHNAKLKLASLDGILKNLVEDLIETQALGSKQRRTYQESFNDETDDLLSIKVRSAPCI